MYDGCNLYTKDKIDRDELIEKLDIAKDDILFVESTDDWLKRKNEKIVIEYNGILDDEEDEGYNGFHYYDVSLYRKNLKQKFEKLNDKNFVVDTE
ncbi:hypothetical protein ACSVC9_10485 [Clostridium sp. LBM24168]